MEKLGESTHTEVLKVCNENEPDHPLVLKRIKPEVSSEDLYFYLDKQIRCIMHLEISNVIIPTLHKWDEVNIFLLQEYFEGINIGNWKRSLKKVSLNDFFAISLNLSKILDDLHRAGHICSGIKPNNIMIVPDTLDVCLIDLVQVIDTKKISHFIITAYYLYLHWNFSVKVLGGF